MIEFQLKNVTFRSIIKNHELQQSHKILPCRGKI